MSDNLTPTEELVLDVLAARYRLGENLWTFTTRCAPAVHRLAARGLVTEMGGITEHTIRASLTEAGRNLWLSSAYAPLPDPETERLKIRNTILAALYEVDQPEAPALATLLSHRLYRGDAA